MIELQVIYIRHARDEIAAYKLVDQRIAQAVDVHHAARSKVENGFLQPRGTVSVDAAAGRLARFANYVAAANGTMLRHVERPAAGALLHYADHLRNDIAAALDQH